MSVVAVAPELELAPMPIVQAEGGYLSPFPRDAATAAFHLDAARDIRVTKTPDVSLPSAAPAKTTASAAASAAASNTSTPDASAPLAPDAHSALRLAKAEELRKYFHSTFELYEKIFEAVKSDEGFYIMPVHKIRHPLIFYLGHTATFYINKLVLAGLTTRLNPFFEETFATGVDEMSWDDLSEGHYNWPAVAKVWQYRACARQRIDALFAKYAEAGGVPLPLTFENSTTDDAHTFYWAMLMGAEHERIHVETASVHLRELPLRFVHVDTPFWAPYPAERAGRVGAPEAVPKNELVTLDVATLQRFHDAAAAQHGTARTLKLAAAAGDSANKAGSDASAPVVVDVPVGRAPDSAVYGWDCDYSTKGYTLPVKTGFKASKYLVSNAEWLDFMAAGAYTTDRFWDEEGLRWVHWKKPSHPWFWVDTAAAANGDAATPVAERYQLRTQVGLVPMPWAWPAEVNHLEARAFCNWKNEQLQAAQPGSGKVVRMPTEAEWCLMYDAFVAPGGDQWEWKRAPGNINLEVEGASACPIDAHAAGPLYDVVGNVWQHLETPTYPYPGFKVHPLYDDFSMPTFDGRHVMMRGGAWISTGNEATRDARFAFRRHFFQCIGVRYVVADPCDEYALMPSTLGLDAPVDLAAQRSFFEPVATPSSENTTATVRGAHAGEQVARVALGLFAQHKGAAITTAAPRRALDVLCGAGRVTFELAATVDEAIGVDFTARMLQPAFAMRERGVATYSVVAHADSAERRACVAEAKAFAWGARREHAFFYQSDPANLHAHLAGFELIVAFDVLGAAYRPSVVAPHLASRLAPGGVLVLFEPAVRAAGAGSSVAGSEPAPAAGQLRAQLEAAAGAGGFRVAPADAAQCGRAFYICTGPADDGAAAAFERRELDVIVVVKH